MALAAGLIPFHAGDITNQVHEPGARTGNIWSTHRGYAKLSSRQPFEERRTSAAGWTVVSAISEAPNVRQLWGSGPFWAKARVSSLSG